MQHKKSFAEQIRDKGYYIVLALCAIAVGVSGYLFCRNLTNEDDVTPMLNEPALAALPEVTKPAVKQPVIAPKQDAAVEAIGEDKLPALAPTEAAEPVAAPVPERLHTQAPLDGEVAQAFAMDHLAYNETMKDWRTHAGVDVLGAEGATVCAAADGTVEAVYSDDFLGWTVTVRHEGGYLTRYSNLAQEIPVTAGDYVAAGQPIGTVGTTALLELAEPPHLHFAVFKDNVPQDPEEFLE